MSSSALEQILRFQFDAEALRRIDSLADGANEGTLSELERNEYQELVEVIDLLAILKAKARNLLGTRAHP